MNRIGFVFVLMALCTLGSVAGETPTEKTQNKEKAWVENFLNEQLIELSTYKPDSHKAVVFVRSKGRLQKEVYFGEPGIRSSSPIFVLYDNEPCMVPDHHGRLLFQVSKIKEESVVFHYTSSFNHNSFGKNLITTDEGEVEIKLRHPNKQD